MRSDDFIIFLNKFSSNIEENIANSIIINEITAKEELKENWDKSQNIENESFKGGEWISKYYKVNKNPYRSKKGRSFKFWYPTYKGHYDKLDLTGDFRENLQINRTLFNEVISSSKVIYNNDIVKRMSEFGINIFSFKKSKKLKNKTLKTLIEIFKNG